MGEIRKLLELVLAIAQSPGVGSAVLLVVIVVGYTLYRDWRQRHWSRAVINEKEAQIQRLAEDNRVFRRYFFMKDGLSDEQIDKLMSAGAGPNPLSLPAPPTKKKSKK